MIDVVVRRVIHADQRVGFTSVDLSQMCIEPFTTMGHTQWFNLNVVSSAHGVLLPPDKKHSAAVQLFIQIV